MTTRVVFLLHHVKINSLVVQAMVIPAGPVLRRAALARTDSVTSSAAAPSPNSESRFAGAVRNWSAS